MSRIGNHYVCFCGYNFLKSGMTDEAIQEKIVRHLEHHIVEQNGDISDLKSQVATLMTTVKLHLGLET